MPKVRWGVLGCASFARRRTIPAMLQSPVVELVAVASRTAEKAEAFRSDFGIPRAHASYEALLEDPEIQAVYIPLPNSLHGEWVVRAAKRGLHALVEKPFTSDAAEAARVTETVGRHGVFVMEAFMWRLHSQHRRARAAVAAGEIGTLRLVRSAFTFRIERGPNVRLVQSLAGGSLRDVGCYPVSAARFYFGEEPFRVYARGTIDPEFGVDMRVSGILEFPSGRANLDCGFDLPYRTELDIVGEKGVISIPRPWQPDPEATIVINGTAERFPLENQYVNAFDHLSTCILEGKQPTWGPADAVKQMRVLDALRRSVESGRPEDV